MRREIRDGGIYHAILQYRVKVATGHCIRLASKNTGRHFLYLHDIEQVQSAPPMVEKQIDVQIRVLLPSSTGSASPACLTASLRYSMRPAAKATSQMVTFSLRPQRP